MDGGESRKGEKENNSNGTYVRKLVRKGKKLMEIVWGILERKFGHHYKRRMMMDDCPIKSTIVYGAEVWGWKEQDKIETIQKISAWAE